MSNSDKLACGLTFVGTGIAYMIGGWWGALGVLSVGLCFILSIHTGKWLFTLSPSILFVLAYGAWNIVGHFSAKPTTPIVAAPASSSTRGFVQVTGNPVLGAERLVTGIPIPINVGVINGGPEPVYNVHTLFREILAPIKDYKGDPDKDAYAWFLKDADVHKQEFIKDNSTGDMEAPGQIIWSTLKITPLTKEQVKGIISGNIRLYTLIWATWKDAPDDLVECVWLQRPTSPQLSNLVWHMCSH